jgi:hypothetical protein
MRINKEFEYLNVLEDNPKRKKEIRFMYLLKKIKYRKDWNGKNL